MSRCGYQWQIQAGCNYELGRPLGGEACCRENRGRSSCFIIPAQWPCALLARFHFSVVQWGHHAAPACFINRWRVRGLGQSLQKRNQKLDFEGRESLFYLGAIFGTLQEIAVADCSERL
jgi:hypothetical protein